MKEATSLILGFVMAYIIVFFLLGCQDPIITDEDIIREGNVVTPPYGCRKCREQRDCEC